MPSSSPPVLSLEAVNALVPKLNTLVGEQLSRRTEIESRLRELAEALGEIPDTLSVDPTDPPPLQALKKDLIVRVEQYQSKWRELEDLGAVVKDPRIGLVDFYGRVDGRLVWLCWKYGETEVNHYHALDEGFAGRKAIPVSMKIRLLN